MPLALQPDDPGRWMAEVERRLRILEATSPLTSASIQNGALRVLDASLVEQLRIGKLLDDSYGLDIAEGAITVGGGPVRAIDLDFQEAQSLNVALTTTEGEHAVATITPPAWATTVVVQAFCLFQMSNGSGASQTMRYRATVNDLPGSGLWTHSVGNAEVANVVDYYQRTLVRGTDFTTTVEASGVMSVGTGTNNANIIRTKLTAYYMR